MYLAQIVFALILTMLISASLPFSALAAEIIKPKPKADPSGGFSVSPTVSNYFFAGSEQRNNPLMYGVKIGYETIEKSVADSLGIEGTFNYFSMRSKADAKILPGYLLRLDVTYPFPINKKWMPFVAVGAGGIVTENNAADRKFLLNYGVGVKYFIENYLAVRVDARQLGVFENAIIRKNYEVGVGLSYYFGKERIKKPKAVPVPEKKKIIVLEDVPVKKDGADKPAGSDSGNVTAVSDTANSVLAAPVIPDIKNELIKTVSIEFDKNSSSIKPSYMSVFKEITDTINTSADVTAQIIKNPDIVGKTTADAVLSEQRIQSIRGNLLRLNSNPKQVSIVVNDAAQPATKQPANKKNQVSTSVEVLIVKMNPRIKLTTEEEVQRKAEQIANEHLQAEFLEKARIKANILLQSVDSSVPVDSDKNLSFEITNQGMSTEGFVLSFLAPKEFDGIMTRVNRPDEKVDYLLLAPGETFKGSALFRIPAGLADGQRTTVTLKAVSTRFNDVIFQKDSLVISAAPLVRVETKLDTKEALLGEKVRYSLSVQNSGSLPARDVTMRVQLPPQVDFINASDRPFTRDATGTLVFSADVIDSGKVSEIIIEVKVRENNLIGQELLWNAEVIEGSVQKRAKYTDRATIVQSK
jgi:OOP family OmpA-OmpF porin